MEHDLSFGDQLRRWRQQRRMSQLDLAVEAELSTRHLSFVETGRAKPSRDLVMRLAEVLGLPLRDRNSLLLAVGYAPTYPERDYDNVDLAAGRDVVQRVLDCHMPFPSLAIDRHWTMLAHNAAVGALLTGVAPELLKPPVNVLRLSLHPQGLAQRIVNLSEWKRHIIERLRHEVAESGDPILEELLSELRRTPAPASGAPGTSANSVAVPLILDSPVGRLTFLSITSLFGTPVEVTMSELAIESFFPADQETAARLAQLAGPL